MNKLDRLIYEKIADVENNLIHDDYHSEQQNRLNNAKSQLEKTLSDEQTKIYADILAYLQNINDTEKCKIYKTGLLDGLDLVFSCRL